MIIDFFTALIFTAVALFPVMVATLRSHHQWAPILAVNFLCAGLFAFGTAQTDALSRQIMLAIATPLWGIILIWAISYTHQGSASGVSASTCTRKGR